MEHRVVRLAGLVAAVALFGCAGTGAEVASGNGEEDEAPVDPSTIQCDTDERESAVLDYAVDAVGTSDDPVEVVRDFLGEHLDADDRLEVVTDDEGIDRVAVVRDGRAVAHVQTADAPGGGGLLVIGYEACSGALRFP